MTESTVIAKGTWIKIPKGTLVQDREGWQRAFKPTSRDVVVQAYYVESLGDGYLFSQWLTADEKRNYEKEKAALPGYGQARGQKVMGEAGVDKKYRDLVKSRVGPRMHIVQWSEGKRAAGLDMVEVVEAPAAKKTPVTKINKRQQMVPKSRWRVTTDFDISFDIENKKIMAGLQVWFRSNPRPQDVGNHSRAAYLQWDDDRQAELERLEAFHGATLNLVVRNVKADEIFTVTGKFLTHNPYHILDKNTGAVARVKFDGDKDEVFVRYKQIEAIIEAESIPTVDVYAIRDKATGLFLRTYPFGNSEYVRGTGQAGQYEGKYVYKGMTNTPEMEEKWMKAKHFDNLGRVKTSILQITGYYDGLDTQSLDASRGYESSYQKEMDLPPTWEVVKFDKLARTEVETIDIQEWYNRAYQLRELTLRFGSSVRSCYKILEKKDELEKYKGMVVVANLVDYLNWGSKTVLTDADHKEIEDAMASAGLTKGTFRKAVDHNSVAIAFANKGAAMLFKLGWNGDLKMSVIDLDEMKEAVGD